jgi:hypothetical protein
VGVFGEEKDAATHVGAHAQVVDAVAVENNLLDDEGGIDEAGKRVDIIVGGLANTDIWRVGRHGGMR